MVPELRPLTTSMSSSVVTVIFVVALFLSIRCAGDCPGGMEHLTKTPYTGEEFQKLVEMSDEVFVVNIMKPKHLPSVQMATAWEKFASVFGKELRLIFLDVTQTAPGTDLLEYLNISTENTKVLPQWRLYHRKNAVSKISSGRRSKKEEEAVAVQSCSGSREGPPLGIVVEDGCTQTQVGDQSSLEEREEAAENRKDRLLFGRVSREEEIANNAELAARTEGDVSDSSLLEDSGADDTVQEGDNTMVGLGTPPQHLSEEEQAKWMVERADHDDRAKDEAFRRSGAADSDVPPNSGVRRRRDENKKKSDNSPKTETMPMNEKGSSRGDREIRRHVGSTTKKKDIKEMEEGKQTRKQGKRFSPSSSSEVNGEEGRSFTTLFPPGKGDSFSRIRTKIVDLIEKNNWRKRGGSSSSTTKQNKEGDGFYLKN